MAHENQGRDKLIESMMTLFPMVHKKMSRSWPNCGLSKLQFELLYMILKANGRPMSFYSEKMMISRSNLTGLCDKLIEQGLVERLADPDDRRIIILKLTTRGIDFMNKHRETIKQQMVKKLDSLDDQDVSRLNDLIDEIKAILNKMD